MAKVVVLDPKKRMRGGCGKIVKAKIEGNKRLSLDITWVKKTSKNTTLWTSRIQANVEAFV